MSETPTNPTTRRRFLAALSVGALAASLSACTSVGAANNTSSTGNANGPKSAALLVFDTANPFVATLVTGAKDAANKAGISLTVSNGNYDNATQISQVQDAISKGVSAIVIQASDAKGIVPAIKLANTANIPVFAVNSNAGEGANIVSFVGADQSEMGKGAADLVAKALPNGGKVALVQGVPGNPIVTLRTEGFTNQLKKTPNLNLVATVTDKFTSDGNLAAVQDLLSKYPQGSLDAIVAQGGELYVGAKYAKSIGRDDVKFIANDYPEQIEEGIKDGSVYGTVNQDPGLQGTRVIEAVNSWLNGDKTAVKQPTDYIPLPLVTSENVSQYAPKWRS
jgi:ABC-type sugar transport system substrate-binding protein